MFPIQQLQQKLGTGSGTSKTYGQSKQLTREQATEKLIEAGCTAGRRTCAGVATIGLVAGTLALVPIPVSSIPLAAVSAGASTFGYGCFLLFGGNPPGELIGHAGKLTQIAYDTVSGLRSLSEESERQAKPGIRELGTKPLEDISSLGDQFTSKIRNFLTKETGIPFNACDKKPSTKQLTKGTSYGDPHMITFDGFKYSFQTVGEFTLVKSTDGNFEVQARQGAISNSASINTAVAIKIGNSRVALYAKNPPDSDTSTPLRVDGKPIKLENGTLDVPGGGKIQSNSSYYLVTAPTGEQVGVRVGSGRMDITPYISGQSGQYIGLLGNANGNPADDLRTRGDKVIPTKENSTYGQVSQALRNVLPVPAPLNQAEKIFFDVVYKEFGDSWRISQAESLFDYPPGKDTGTFTNRSFPNS